MNTERKTVSCYPRGYAENDLAAVETSELIALYKETGDESLKWEIVLRYAGVVKKIAAQYYNLFGSFAQLDDIVQEGLLVLSGSVDKFDPSKGIKFETYISKRLRGLMIDLARKQDWVPRSVRQNAIRVNRASQELTARLGCQPTHKEIADYLGLSMEEYQNLRADVSSFHLLSLEGFLESRGTAGEGEESCCAEETDNLPEEAYLEKELHSVLTKGISSLKEKEQTVLSLYYEKELNMKEIAEVLGISTPRVSQIHRSAIQHLRTFMEAYAAG